MKSVNLNASTRRAFVHQKTHLENEKASYKEQKFLYFVHLKMDLHPEVKQLL
jgi:hypothetical protein